MARRSHTGKRQTNTSMSLPPFTGGVNSQAALREMQPNEMIFGYNIISKQQGLETRKGTQEWNNSINSYGRTVIPFESQDGTKKLFICGTDGIYEATTSGDGTASKVYSFSVTGVTSGYGVFVQFTNDAGAAFILYADSANGLLEYTVASNSWGVPSGITGCTVGDIRFVGIHKQRVWFAVENSDVGYYLPIGSKAGSATAFYFGGLFPNGGDLVGFWTWTRDGGNGIDDYFIAISRGGDLLAYQGADPSSASTWSLVGNWHLGQVPAGRRVAISYGGELFVLSLYGVITLSALFRGVDISDFKFNVTAKITDLIRDRMLTEINNDRWELQVYAQEGLLIVNSPSRPGQTDQYLQYVFNFTKQAWGLWRGINMYTSAPWNEFLYITDDSGIVWYLTDGPDNRLIADTDSSEVIPVDFSLLSAYQKNTQGVHGIAELVRATFSGQDAVGHACRIVYDYELDELDPVGEASSSDGPIWDTDVWDTAVWSGTSTPRSTIQGTSGIGRSFAVAVRGSVSFQTKLIDVDIVARSGGWL